MCDLIISWPKLKNLRSTLVLTSLLFVFAQPFCLVQAQQTDEQETSEAQQIAEDVADADLVRTQNQLAFQEGLADAYDKSIGELSLEIGNLLAAQGKTEEALSSFRRALHISRINNGLDSDLQLPILETILDLYTSNHQIQLAADTLNRIYRVHQKNYSSTDPASIRLLMRIGIWHFSAYFFNIDNQRLSHLLQARMAFGLAYNAFHKKETYNFDLYNLLAMTDYGLANIANISESSGSNEIGVAGSSQVAGSIISGSYRRGKVLLENGIKNAEKSEDTASLVRATLLYADWNQMFNKRHAARKLYQNAYKLALNLDADSQLRQSFNHPHQLPEFNAAVLNFGPKEVESQSVPVSFDVDKWGMSSNIEILPREGHEKTPHPVKRAARNAVRTVAYRPAIVDGQPIDSVGVTQTVIVEL